MTKVSVIVPVYNAERYLDVCVQSLVRQTLKDIEIILVDDGSTDNSPTLCDEYAKTDSRIKVIHKKNGGISSARNEGMTIASGKYVAFCDSDDYLALNAYDVCYKLAKQTDADEVRFLMRRFSDKADIKEDDVSDNCTLAKTLIDRLNPMLANMAPLLATTGGSVAVSDASQCTAIYKMSLIREQNLKCLSEKEFISEDFFFNIDFGIACRTIVFTENVFYNYRHNSQSVSMTFNPRRDIRNMIEVPQFLANALKPANYPDAEIFTSGHMFGALFAAIKNIFKSGLSLKEKKDVYSKLPFDTLREAYAKYPVGILPVTTRLRFEMVISEKFWLCLAVEKVKNLLLKFRKG